MSAQIGKIIKGKGKNIKGIIKNMSEIIEHNKRVGHANPSIGVCAPEERGLLTVKMLNRNQETTMREGLRACKRVAFLRRRHKNAECIARCIRFPGALPRARGNNWAFSPPQSNYANVLFSKICVDFVSHAAAVGNAAHYE